MNAQAQSAHGAALKGRSMEGAAEQRPNRG
jgi:hypothetical protein